MVAFNYRVTVHTDDIDVLFALRGLAHGSQKKGTVNASWGGTGEAEWRAANQKVTFKFSDPRYRVAFLDKGNRLLPSLWTKVSEQNI
jgi:hypothetical protein